MKKRVLLVCVLAVGMVTLAFARGGHGYGHRHGHGGGRR